MGDLSIVSGTRAPLPFPFLRALMNSVREANKGSSRLLQLVFTDWSTIVELSCMDENLKWVTIENENYAGYQ